MAKDRKKLLELFLASATPEERLEYEKRELEKKIKALQEIPPEVIKGDQGEPGEKPTKEELVELIQPLIPPIEGTEVVSKINELPLEPSSQIDFLHIRNFPWHKVNDSIKDSNRGGLVSWGDPGLNLKEVTKAQITVDQNDYELGIGSMFRLSSDASRTITGLVGGTSGEGIVLINVGSFDIVLANQSASSGGINRIITGTGADVTLSAAEVAFLFYDNATERWRMFQGGGGSSVTFGTDNQIPFINAGGTDFDYSANLTFNGTVFTTNSVNVSGLTASELVATDASKNLQSLSVATYPSLTELTYVKGVTSAIQTQLNAKQASITSTDTHVLFSDGANNPAGDAGFTYNKNTNIATLAGGLVTPELFTNSANSGTTISITAGDAASGDTNGGSVNFYTGNKTGAGVSGTFRMRNGGVGVGGILDFKSITTSDKTFTFPDTTGTLALVANPTDITVPDEAYGVGWNASLEVPTKNAVYDKVETLTTATISFIIDGGGSEITTGIKGDLEIPFNCTINRVTLLADQSGSIVVDIWKDTYANYPPADADSITASAVPTISTATNSQDATLTGWTTTVTAGDTLRFNVDSITTCTRVLVSLKVTRT